MAVGKGVYRVVFITDADEYDNESTSFQKVVDQMAQAGQALCGKEGEEKGTRSNSPICVADKVNPMPRTARIAPPGVIYHCLNRGCGRATLFDKAEDFDAFERVLDYALQCVPTRILSYCLMPNHWHFVLWPREEGELTCFLRRLTHTHTQRRHAHRHTAGTGHLYQGRFKSFPVQQDDHLLAVNRYVERNALRAKRVDRAEHWRWSSLWRRENGNEAFLRDVASLAIANPRQLGRARQPASHGGGTADAAAIVDPGTPFGSERWQLETARRLVCCARKATWPPEKGG